MKLNDYLQLALRAVQMFNTYGWLIVLATIFYFMLKNEAQLKASQNEIITAQQALTTERFYLDRIAKSLAQQDSVALNTRAELIQLQAERDRITLRTNNLYIQSKAALKTLSDALKMRQTENDSLVNIIKQFQRVYENK